MKKALILNTSHNDLRMILALKELGYFVVSLGSQPNLIGQKYVDKYIQQDYSDKEKALEIAESEKIDAVCACCNDFGVITAAFIAENLNLPGHDTLENVYILHHKDKFKQFCKANNISTPPAEYFSMQNEAFDYIETLAEFPIIVKPTDLSAGNGISRADNLQEAKSAVEYAFSKSRVKRIVIEPFIDGSQHGFCTFLINRKVAALCTNNEYSFLNKYRVEIDTFPSDNFEKVKDFLIAEIEKFAEILNLKDGIFHLQYRMKDGKPYIIEAMRRTLGNMYGVPAEKLTGINWDYWEVVSHCGLDLSDFPRDNRQNGFFAYKTLVAAKNGFVDDVQIPQHLQKFVFDKCILWEKDAPITNYMSQPLGFLFLQFGSREQMEENLIGKYDYSKSGV